jgi:hypothetical protein
MLKVFSSIHDISAFGYYHDYLVEYLPKKEVKNNIITFPNPVKDINSSYDLNSILNFLSGEPELVTVPLPPDYYILKG